MKLFENAGVIISLNQDVPCLEWIGKPGLISDDFRESEEQSLKFYQQYKPQHPKLEWFVDARKIRALPGEDVEWVAANILPQFARAGLKKEVFVVPESALGRFVVNNYIDQATGKEIEVNAFATVEEAYDWLKQ